MKKEVREALQKAKKIEKEHLPSREEIVTIYKEGMSEAEKLKKLLKPQWFVKDVHKKKKSSPTRKKKSL